MEWGKFLGITMAIAKLREEEEKELETMKLMGQRILITGVQMGLMLSALKLTIRLLDGSLHPDDHPTKEDVLENSRRQLEELKEIMETQFIGQSKNSIEDDVNDLMNLFASWCSKTGD